MLNKMIIQGNFVTTPEIKQTQSGKSVTSFRLAWSETYKEVKSELFVNCVAWGYTAEFISKYFMKGSQIIVEGRLISRSYEDDTGTKKYITELVVENCHFSGHKNATQNNENETVNSISNVPPKNTYKGKNENYTQDKFKEDGDLPF